MEASSSSAPFEFDVFLSFRGKDTRKGFTGHLYDRLKLHGISAFKDSEDLERGQEIEELLNYIERSMILMPIFSMGYAESRWCLKEITMMVACRRLIIPVFFDVEPLDVRDQIDHFAHAFERYQKDTEIDQQEVSNWRRALETVGSLCGFHLKNDADGDEAKLVLLIVRRVLKEVSKFPYQVAEHPIGVDAHVNEVKKLCKYGSAVQFIGIHGMGGIGKTTIAKAIYNDLFLEFEASSFLFNIREKFQQHRELELQRQLTHDILKIDDPQIYSVEDGKGMIKNRMNSKKVLIILDDIDDGYQLDALAGGRDWFGHGSMIFITTRNWKVIQEHGLSEGQIYKVNGLNYEQSCYLFKWYAFKGREPEKGCRQLLDAFVKAGGGIPLALQMIGLTLAPKRKVQEWKYLLDKLQHIPVDRIQERLRISYDGLKEEEQKQIFLDISCFFIGKDREKATHMWEACGLYPKFVIPVLLSRSLINIDQHGEFSMHDLVRDMGREIVRQHGIAEPWMISRLWSSQDIFVLLRQMVPIERVKGIMLPKSRNDFEGTESSCLQNRIAGQRSNLDKCFTAQCFELMLNLRILQLEGISFEGNFQHFPKGLRWLALENCRFTSPPHDFDIEKVALLDLSGCSLMAECFTNYSLMRTLDLSYLKFLNLARTEISSTPDFTNVRWLEKLILSDCTKLTKVHESIGILKSLLSLDLGGCKILSKIPDSVCRLSSLKSFDLRKCAKVEYLPESLGNMKSLQKLYLDSTSIETLPDSIGSLTRLGVLSLKGCMCLNALPSSFRNLVCLQHMIVQGTFVKGRENNIYYKKEGVEVRASSLDLLAILPNLFCRRICRLTLTDYKTEELPDSMKNMTNLSSLELHCHAIRELPSYIGSLRRIKKLKLLCMELKSLPNSVGALKELVTFEIFAGSMKALPDSIGELESLEILLIRYNKLTSLPHSIGYLENLRTLLLYNCFNLKDLPASISSLGRLQRLSLTHCHNLKKLSLASVPQPGSSQPSALSQPLSQKMPEQSGHASLLQRLSSSLFHLEVSHCVRLREVNVSNLQSLVNLDLRGCDLLEDILGLENITNLEILVLPAPACALSDNFNERSFKRASFPQLQRFVVESTEGNVRLDPFLRGTTLPALTEVPREHTLPSGLKNIVHQTETLTLTPAISWVRRGHLPFLLPNVPHANRRLRRAQFTFERLPSPILISVVADDGRLLFETTKNLVGSSLNLCSDDEIVCRLRDIISGTIGVTADMSRLSRFSASFEWEMKRLDDLQKPAAVTSST
ncbi:disease resistance protein RUN1-like isoform X2 [Nymphaea colorata]|uniref:disease resistance protein RUN1-like isoform X2 n=1 Tax=Nymphaea colorata TaxID=210225 RepID=UPI00129E5B35|nr:disease resistance protein RUN1-like isoform X2 [Nymphaea colorata]